MKTSINVWDAAKALALLLVVYWIWRGLQAALEAGAKAADAVRKLPQLASEVVKAAAEEVKSVGNAPVASIPIVGPFFDWLGSKVTWTNEEYYKVYPKAKKPAFTDDELRILRQYSDDFKQSYDLEKDPRAPWYKEY